MIKISKYSEGCQVKINLEFENWISFFGYCYWYLDDARDELQPHVLEVSKGNISNKALQMAIRGFCKYDVSVTINDKVYKNYHDIDISELLVLENI